jgi:hypothetical protein
MTSPATLKTTDASSALSWLTRRAAADVTSPRDDLCQFLFPNPCLRPHDRLYARH